MSWLDITLFAIMALSILLGIISGLVIQIFNILILVLGIVLASHLDGPLAELFGNVSDNEQACRIVAFILIFLVITIGLRVLAFFVRGAVKKLRFGTPDRILGGLVGALKGYLICVAVFLTLMHVQSGALHAAAEESVLLPPLGESVSTVRVWVSEENRERAVEYLKSLAGEAKEAAGKAAEKTRDAAEKVGEMGKAGVDKVREIGN